MTTSTELLVEPIYDVTRLPGHTKWTRDLFHRAVDMGVFAPEDNLELIYGELIKKMGMNRSHAAVLLFVENALRAIFGDGFVVRNQLPFVAPDESEPEPDLAIVRGVLRDALATHPSSAELLVEISDTTLAQDLGTKSSLYAQAGVGDYWVVDINARIVHVHRTPIASSSLPNGYGYQTITRFLDTDSISPLAAPSHSIRVADILP